MLNKITLKNFRKHRELTVTFGAGMTAIRALNEQGKSTLLEAVSYAIGGVKAIRDSLDDCVTWGEPTNTLKVELELAVDGVVYTIKRGKSGAEVNYDGGIVTGQNEVTSFVARLLKVDAGASARLTLSNQNEIRGALEAGPKATTEMIERLAEFDQIDRLLEVMQEKLTLGSPTTVESRIASAEAALASAEAAAVPFDSQSAITEIAEADTAHTAAVQKADLAAEALVKAQEAHSAVRERIVKRAGVVRDVEKADETISKLGGRIATQNAVKAPDNAEARTADLNQRIANVKQHRELRKKFDLAQQYRTRRPGATFKGTSTQLRAAITAAQAIVSSALQKTTARKGDIKLLEAQLTHGTCSFCGKDFSGVPEVAAKNEQISSGLAHAKKLLEAELLEHETATAQVALLRGIERDSTAGVEAHLSLGDLVTLADGEMPPILVWKGAAVTDVVEDAATLREQLSSIESEVRAYDAAQALLGSLKEQAIEASAAREALLERLAGMPEEDSNAAQADLEAARDAETTARNTANQLRDVWRDAKNGLRDKQAAYDRAVEARDAAQEALKKLVEDLRTLEFNNALLKRVRQARPMIADQLWNIVLAAVSGYFSEIRGVKSKVSKDSEGFKIDGKPISSMSGSTLDALGLAIRVALVRTFLPSSPFLILDEPAAAMDGDRTGNMLGFLSTCGFQQILLVTHEEVSQDIADHVITL